MCSQSKNVKSLRLEMANPALCKKHVRVHFHIVPIITPRSSMCTIHNIPGNKNVSIHMITCTVSTVGQKNRPGTAQDIIALKSAMAKFPVKKDFLWAFSTCPGDVSFRHSTLGSFFIQALCKVGTPTSLPLNFFFANSCYGIAMDLAMSVLQYIYSILNYLKFILLS